ncbi:MAG TPA: PDZ domain-containing protein [Panacibacter sp.]|nr:PDZ domain-containing protein [Panacibacter sp.]
MNKIVKSSVLLLAVILTAGEIHAQNKMKTKPDNKSAENIIIRKKGDSKEKLTIVVDGDNITVNGKPVDDFKSDDIDIIRNEDMMPMGMSMNAPMPPEGGWKMFGDDFMKEIHSNKAFLGVMTKKADDGAKITEVTKESAAEKAGLKEGDVITKVGDEKIEDADDLYTAIGKYKPEDKVTVTYKRDGKEGKVTATLAENKQVRAFSWKNGDGGGNSFNYNINPRIAPRIRGWNGDGDFDWNDEKPRLGVQVQDTEDDKGVKLLEVDEDEPADKAGLEEDDIITQFNGKNITSVDSFKEMMKDVKKGDTIKLTYLRDGKSQTADVKFPKDLKTTDL